MNKILIIDDDARLVKNLSTYLKDFNYQTEAAYNGTEGLKKIESFSPDLVILDLMMPEIDGLDVCREIRKTRSVPVIMLTARGEEPDIVAGLRRHYCRGRREFFSRRDEGQSDGTAKGLENERDYRICTE